jgi:FAD/FMN-containing dehydrogenase
MNVALADGSTIAVNETSHKDLFWAMRGAGHNFGIVTSLKLKIYPIRSTTWHYHNYIWTQDKLETLFEELNKIQDNGNTPVLWGSSFGEFRLNQSISENEVRYFPSLILPCRSTL